MKKVTYSCDRCGAEITDVLYTLRCYADDLTPGLLGCMSDEVMEHNMKQNIKATDAHLCRACKDAITDGVFIQ